MKRTLIALAAASTLVGISATPSRGDELAAHRPATAGSTHSAMRLERARDAVTNYVNACADDDRRRLRQVLADDATIELPLAEPGHFLVGDAAELCDLGAPTGHVTHLRVYPAGDGALFVSFNQNPGTPRLVLIELRGNQISRLRDFTADSAQVQRYAAGQQRHKSKEPS
jgi:hypothetical protein